MKSSVERREELGHALRGLRKELRVTQEEFGPVCGVSTRTVLRWENMKGEPSRHQAKFLRDLVAKRAPHLLAKISEVLGIPYTLGPSGLAPTRLQADLRTAADDADITARALRRAMRAVLSGLRGTGTTVDALYEALGQEAPKGPADPSV